MAQGAAPSGEPDAVARHVIVLGLSQHGKTLFLNGLRGFQERRDPELTGVGDGTVRCTTRPTHYNLHPEGAATQVLRYVPLPPPTFSRSLQGVDLEKARRDYWVQLRKDNGYSCDLDFAEPLRVGRNPNAGINHGMRYYRMSRASVASLPDPATIYTPPRLCVKALDTPGLEDNNNEDDLHIERVIDEVLQLESLSGLVMVTKCGAPVTPSWADQVLRYWNLFPMMRTQWIFVHTCGDPFAARNPNRRKQGSFEASAEERVKAVMTTMRRLTEDDSFDAAHLFIESDCLEADFDGHQVLKAFLAEQHNIFFSLVANFRPVVIGGLNFEKGEELKGIDNQVLHALEATLANMRGDRERLDTDLRQLLETQEANARMRSQKEEDLQKVEKLLSLKDHDGPVDRVAYVCQPYWYFHFAEQQVVIDTLHKEYTVSLIDTSGYNESYLKEDETRRQVEILPNGCHRLTITCQVPQLLYRMQGKVVVSSESCDVHAEEIKRLKAEQAQLSNALQMMTVLHQVAEQSLSHTTDLARRTEAQFKSAREAIKFLREDWDVSTWRSMREFYDWCKATVPRPSGQQLVRQFQKRWLEAVKTRAEAWDFEPVDIVPSKDVR